MTILVQAYRSCLRTRLKSLIGNVPGWVLDDITERGWRGFGWQWLKRRIAEYIAECLGKIGAKSVYLVELHGGEHIVEDFGDKDIDLLVECGADCGWSDDLDSVTENTVAEILGEMLGANPYRVLGVPNIVEIHVIGRSYVARHVGDSYARPIKLL